ncbi:CD209 antigen-like protein E isoform X5 [Perca fluviatilis]|uniref:CD209 antigen-like protein E isoform X5 n=1 Tax=Perca fluviatilis TaxID=8168 RepID=UPI0019642772|nr:CD209 antigen-like protein E isoform X5 [Perca fluviatilis]
MNRNPQEEIEEIEEEAEAVYVTLPACTVEKVAAPPDQRFRCFSQYFLPITVCWLILLVIMGLRIYFATLSHESDVSELMAANRNLTNLNDKLSVLENQITNLTAVNQELETERNNLRRQIQNISRAQGSIDEYCPKENNVSERGCRDCQKDWELINSSCYLVNGPPDQKTWEEARKDCRARGSDLVVVDTRDEQNALRHHSRYGSWIGLRAEGGRWKWIDGSDLVESVTYWIDEPPPPTDGQCAVTTYIFSWTSVSCAERNGWICEKKPLSV